MFIIYSQFDIFQYETLLLPWHIPKMKHWVLVGVDTRLHTIQMYDSLAEHPTSHKHICEVSHACCLGIQHLLSSWQRVLRFLAWEYTSLYSEEISPDWKTNLEESLLGKVSVLVKHN